MLIKPRCRSINRWTTEIHLKKLLQIGVWRKCSYDISTIFSLLQKNSCWGNEVTINCIWIVAVIKLENITSVEYVFACSKVFFYYLWYFWYKFSGSIKCRNFLWLHKNSVATKSEQKYISITLEWYLECICLHSVNKARSRLRSLSAT